MGDDFYSMKDGIKITDIGAQTTQFGALKINTIFYILLQPPLFMGVCSGCL